MTPARLENKLKKCVASMKEAHKEDDHERFFCELHDGNALIVAMLSTATPHELGDVAKLAAGFIMETVEMMNEEVN